MLPWSARSESPRRSRRKKNIRRSLSLVQKSGQFGGSLERRRLLTIEGLEERIVLAWDMTLGIGATVNVASSTAASTTTFTATGTGANLDWNDVYNALNAGNSVEIDSGSTGAEAGNITDTTGFQFSPLAAANLSLAISSGTGAGLVGDISLQDINLDSTNASIVVQAHGSVTTGVLSGGLFAAPLPLANAEITAENGSVNEGGFFPGPIVAANLAIQAKTGIGVSATPLPTKVGTLSAQTATGGIFISNTGDLTIGGGLIAGVNGVQDTGASGDIALTNAGSVTIASGGDIVKGPGDVAITANGAAADILTGGNNSGVDGGTAGAVQAGAGALSLNAGRDILVGDVAGGSYGDVSSSGSLSLVAGRNISVDQNSFLNVYGAGALSAAAAANISFLNSGAVTGARTQGGSMTFATGAGGVFTVNTGGPSPNSGIRSNFGGGAGGAITISADDMAIDDAIAAGGAVVTLQQATTTAHAIDLGGGAAAGDLGLSDAELAFISAGALRIGRGDNAGDISLTAPVTAHAGYSTLSLVTGGGLSDVAASDTITATNLAVRAAAGVSLDTAVSNLAVRNTTSGDVRVANAGALTLTAVDALDGSAGNELGNFAAGGASTFSAAGPITFASNYTSAGTIVATTTETASETATPLPPPDDDITVNSGVTVESTGGDVDFTSGDSIVVPLGATVKSDAGAINLTPGVGDVDNDAALNIGGTLSGTVNLVYNMAANTTLTIDVNGGNVEVKNGATVVLSAPLASTSSLTIDGSTGETLIINNSVGGIVNVPTINFNNSAPSNNKLDILGGAFTNETFDYAGQHDGDVKFVYPAGASTINYTNLTPILANVGSVTDLVFNLPAGPNQAVLKDSGALVELHSDNLVATFEDTTFTGPSGTLTVHRGSAADTLDIQTANLGSTLIVGATGAPFAAATVTNPLTPDLGAGNLTLHADTININAAVNTTAGTTGDVVLDAGSALNIAVGSNINAKGSVTQTGAGAVSLGADVTTSDSQVSFTGAVTLTSASVTIDTGTSAVTFGGALDGLTAGADALIVTGNATFENAVGGGTRLKSLTVTGSTAINGGAVTTTAGQSYGDNVTLGAATTTLASTGAGAIDFAQKLDGPSALTVNTSGLTTFGGAVGTTPLISLTTDAPGSTAINGGAVTTTAGQSYGDNVTLGAAATTLTSTGAGDIDFAQKLDGASALTVATNGLTTFGGAVGTTPLISLTTDAPGTTAINGGAVTTTAGQSYGDNVTLGAATTTLASTGAGAIDFAQKLDGPSALTINTSGLTTFGGTVGTTPLTSLTTDALGSTAINGGSVTTSGAQTYNDAVTLGNNTTLTSTGGGDVTLGKTVDGLFSLAVNTAGVTALGGAVGSSNALTSLTTDAPGSTAINGGSVTTSGAQTYNDAVTLQADANLFTLNANEGVAFGSTIESLGAPHSLSIDATGGQTAGVFGVVTFNGEVGGGGNPLAALTITSGPFTLKPGIHVTTTGDVLITVAENAANVAGDDLELKSGSTVTSTGGKIELRAGDNVNIDAGSAVAALAGTITIRGDYGNNDSPAGATINLDGVIDAPTVNVFGGDGSDTINVQQTQAGTTTNINAGAGDDVVNLSSTAGGATQGVTSTIAGAINVNGGDGNDTLNIDDRNDAASTLGTLTATTVSGLGMGPGLGYAGLEQVNVSLGGNANLDFKVQTTLGTTPVHVTGQGVGTVDVGDLGNRLNGIAGTLVVDRLKTLNLNDQGSTAGQTYNITNMAIGRPLTSPRVLVEYLNMGTGTVVQVNGGNQLGGQLVDDTFNLFLPTPADQPIDATLRFDGGTSSGGFHNKLNVVASQSLTPTAGNVYHAHVGTFNSTEALDPTHPSNTTPIPIQIQNIQSLYMYGSPVDSNDFANLTNASSVMIGGANFDTLQGSGGVDVLFGGGTPLTNPNPSVRFPEQLSAGGVSNPIPGSGDQDYVFVDFRPQFNPDGSVSYNGEGQNLAGNGSLIQASGGSGTVVSLLPNTNINNASTVIQNNGQIDVITWLTARFASPQAIGTILQTALANDPVLSGLQAPPAGPSPLPVATKAPGPTLAQWETFVAAAFNDILGRAASPADVSYWAGQLNTGMSRADFANELTHSDEYYQNKIIAPDYQKYLGRAPDAAGLAYWTAQMRNGLTDEQLEAGFIGSDEFYMTQGHGTDAGWIDALYQDLLGRPADAQGKAFWLAQLQAGETRSQVALGFTDSLERERQRVAGDYQTFLNRLPDQQGIDFWVGQFALGLSNESLIAGFVASDEYFAKHS